MKTARARTDITVIAEDLVENLAYFRDKFGRARNPEADKRWAEIETFCTLALRIMAKTNPSKVRNEAMTLEIAARMHGREVLED